MIKVALLAVLMYILAVAAERCTVSPLVVQDGTYQAIVLDGSVQRTMDAERYFISFSFFDAAGVYTQEHGYEVSQGEYMRYYRGGHELCVTPRYDHHYHLGGCQ